MSTQNKYTKKPKKNTKNRILTQSDSQISQRTEAPNVFLQTSNQYLGQASKASPKKQAQIPKYKRNRQSRGKRTNELIFQQRTKQQMQDDMQLVNDSQIPQGQQEIEENTQFSLFQSHKYYMGQIANPIKYPYSKIIAVDNNNSEQNALNRKLLRLKRQSNPNLADSNQYYLENKIGVSFFLFLLHALSNTLFIHVQFYLYLSVMVVNYVIQLQIFRGNAQYVGEPGILLAVAIVYFVGNFVIQVFSSKNRAKFEDDQQKFKVYSHDSFSAEWTFLPAAQMKAGQIFKVPSGSKFPVDSVLIHSAKSLVHIDQNQVRGQFPQTILNSTLKETVVKSATILLPISGTFQYKISNAQIKNNWLQGNLILQEPIQVRYNVGVDNIVIKGSKITSKCEVLCMALEVGTNSIYLKNVQYHYLYKQHEDIMPQNSKFLTIKKLTSYFLFSTYTIYFILIGIGILVGFTTNRMTKEHYYLGQQVKIPHLLFYHSMNFIILIPVLLRLSVSCYIYLMGRLTQSNISQRQFHLTQAEHQSASQTIGKVSIKDYQILPHLNNQFTLISGMQLFKQKKQFKLTKIIVKQIKFQFGKHRIQDQLFEQEQKDFIRYFMSVSLLTTLTQGSGSEVSFENSIRKMGKQLGLNLSQLKQHLTVSGPLGAIFSEGKLEVIHIFTVQGCTEYPFSISFYQIPTVEVQQNNQRRVLCLLRGDPQTVLKKAYGKKVNMLIQSDRLHQQEGLQVHFVGKFTIFYNDALSLKNSYESPTIQKSKFYELLEPYFKKIEPMGLLAFENEFSQQNTIGMKMNPLLNLSYKRQLIGPQHKFSSQRLPNMILISPQVDSFCPRPQFESVNTINSILGNPLLFNLTQRQISDKILYDPIPVQEMIQKLNRERIVVFNGWQMKNIDFMVNRLKQKGVLTMGIIQKQDQIYLSKLCHYSISRSHEVDIQKYTDIAIEQRQQTPKTMSILTIMQLLNHDSHITYDGTYYIVLVYIVKTTCYLVVQAVNLAYTLGSGISLIRLPLYLLTQIVIFMDLFYYLNIKDSCSMSTHNKGDKGVSRSLQYNGLTCSIPFVVVKTLMLSVMGVLIIINSSISPVNSQGTPVNSVFCVLHVHLFITHLMIFSKLTWGNKQINIYKILIILLQLAVYYVGLVIVSETSLYEFNKVIAYMFNNRIYLVTLIVIWVVFNFNYAEIIAMVFGQLMQKKVDNDYRNIKRVNKQTNLQVLQL